jgi:AcrR family transcriptional regulator
MSPRPYRMARRRETADRNRVRIIAAARELLTARDGTVRFSVEEVARRAGLARMTVYYQFGSLRGLLEALLDSLASTGGMENLADAFRRSDPFEALDRFIAVFVGFWESDRSVLRALGAFTALDPELAEVIDERSGWRRKGLRILMEGFSQPGPRGRAKARKDREDVLFMLTSFAVYDMLAVDGRTADQVTQLLQGLARKALA